MGKINFELKLWHIVFALSIVIIISARLNVKRFRSPLRASGEMGRGPGERNGVPSENIGFQKGNSVPNLIYTTTKFVSKNVKNGILIEKYVAKDTLGDCLRYYLSEFEKSGWLVTKNEFINTGKKQELAFIKEEAEIRIELSVSKYSGTEITIYRKENQ